ncbi:MAG: hypothetical protein C0617_05720 [Desulfuromonas sp.]|nr:MAG: hypothetical protein C0617_05720 [Desulfuromonas sp.]
MAFKASPNNVKFSDLCRLAVLVGFQFARQQGTSHKIYKHDIYTGTPMNFQSVKGKGKPYQVRQLIEFIDRYDLLSLGE